MGELSIPGTFCKMTYRDAPSDNFVQQFTVQKQRIWGEIEVGIDNYVHAEIFDRIRAVVDLAPNAKRFLSSSNFSQRIQKKIDVEFNRGLAIIAHSPEVAIYGNSPYSIVDYQPFSSAIGLLIAEFMNLSKEQRRLRVNRSLVWADACCYRIMEAAGNGLARKARRPRN